MTQTKRHYIKLHYMHYILTKGLLTLLSTNFRFHLTRYVKMPLIIKINLAYNVLIKKAICMDSLFTVSTFKEETELIPSKSLSPDLDSQSVLRLVKEVPRSLNKQNSKEQQH